MSKFSFGQWVQTKEPRSIFERGIKKLRGIVIEPDETIPGNEDKVYLYWENHFIDPLHKDEIISIDDIEPINERQEIKV